LENNTYIGDQHIHWRTTHTFNRYIGEQQIHWRTTDTFNRYIGEQQVNKCKEKNIVGERGLFQRLLFLGHALKKTRTKKKRECMPY